jgi:hypothetical protein
MDIELIKQKLRELIELDPDADYTYINEPLTEEAVSSFEAAHNIKLPNDYRIFITEMFDGGFGPFQIMPLEFWDSIHNTVYLDSLENDLSKPFPLTNAVDFEENFDPSLVENSTSMLDGTIRICHIGSGNFIFLVVNGEEYGNLWMDYTCSNDEMLPLTLKNKDRVSFEDWYIHWLDESIRSQKEQRILFEKDIDSKNKIVIKIRFKEDGSLVIHNFFSNIDDIKTFKKYLKFDLGKLNSITIDASEMPKLFNFYNVQDRMLLLDKIKADYNNVKAMKTFKSFLKKQKIEFG